MASYYATPRVASSRRHNMQGIIGVIRHQRESGGEPPAANDAKPSSNGIKLGVLTLRAAKGWPLFPGTDYE